MVDGLMAAAEMAEFVAGAKSKEADRRLAQKDFAGAATARSVALEMTGLAQSLRSRASAIDTGEYVPIGADPGPGWRRRQRLPSTEGSHTKRIRVRPPRRSWKSLLVALRRWWAS